MKGLIRVMLILSIVLLIISFSYELPETNEVILLSLVFGILVFILSVLVLDFVYLKGWIKNKFVNKKILEKRKVVYSIALIIMILSIIIFLNSFLYVKFLTGNDLLISLNPSEKNILLKNGEEEFINLNARVLINPFCSADCSLLLKDLGNDEVLYNRSASLSFSDSFSEEISVKIEEESYGKRLYEVSLQCKSAQQGLCYTKNESVQSRTEIISIYHELNDVQKDKKENLKNRIESINEDFYVLKDGLSTINLNLSPLNFSYLEEDFYYINDSTLDFFSGIEKMKQLYESQEYHELEQKIENAEGKLSNLSSEFLVLNQSFFSDLAAYNNLTEALNLVHDEILFLEDYNFSNYSVVKANSFVENFNLLVINLSQSAPISEKIIYFDEINNEKEILFSILTEEENSSIIRNEKLNSTIYEVNLSKINITPYQSTNNFTLYEPSPICCFKNKCYPCIDDSSSNYPVILLHGHIFNEDLSAESGLESFNKFSERLEDDGYINAGSLYVADYKNLSFGYLGGVNSSAVFRSTYYLDPFGNKDTFSLDVDWGDMDNYALRLNEAISNVKYITGKDKVIVVTHSMGGLVARRYMQIYGTNDLDKIIFIAAPNHGIDGIILRSCPVLGADVECSEMDKESSFIKSLNKAPIPKTPVYNIIGLGCSWEGSIGDGTVKNESAYLDWAQNIYFNGTCDGIDLFHVNILDPDKYPEVYEEVKKIIENEE